ncbi:MAG: hypothetical protein ABI831_07550 [Betaproteobacteria bacterium]
MTPIAGAPAEHKIIQDAANESRAYQRQVSRAAAQVAVNELEAEGMQYNEMSAAEHQRMGRVAKPVSE